MKLQITFDPINGEAIADGNCETRALGMVLKGGNYVIGTFLLIEYIRLAIKQEMIDLNEFELIYKNEPVIVDKQGRIAVWPLGFGDHLDDVLMKLLV